MSRRRRLVATGAGVAASATVLARRAKRVTAFPPGPDAITVHGARARAKALLEQPRRSPAPSGTLVGVRSLDEALQVGVCLLITMAVAWALLGVWRDDHNLR